jgi:Uncharacterized protein conserved in bacteria (DUF2188)
VFRRRYAPLGFVAWLVAKQKLRGLAARFGIALLAAAGVVAAALVTRRLVRPLAGRRGDAGQLATIRLAYEDDEWVIRRDGDGDPLERHRTKADAEKAARARAQDERAALVVYTREGEVQRQHSYAGSA